MLFMTPRKSMVRLPKKCKDKFDSAELKVWNVRNNNTKSLFLYKCDVEFEIANLRFDNLELRIQWPEKAPDNCIRRKKWKSKNNIYKCKISLLKCTISVTKLRPQLHTKWTIWVVTFGTRWWLCNDLMRQNYAHFEIDVALMVAKA
jgi:hypothetical protein